jgi:hypothetical protein
MALIPHRYDMTVFVYRMHLKNGAADISSWVPRMKLNSSTVKFCILMDMQNYLANMRCEDTNMYDSYAFVL